VNASTTILAFLAKSGKGNNNQQDGDTKILVPNVFQNVIQVPIPFNFFNSVPQVATAPAILSTIQTDSRFFNVAGTTFIVGTGPGLWEIEWAHWVTPEGAVNDLTSLVRLQLALIEGTNPTVDLSRFNNTGAVRQSLTGRFRVTIPSEQQLNWFVNTTLGAGTGTNRSNIRITMSKFL
jgi:hypothetical protein